MNVNPDPRPGRWMLPLVVLGMVTFTWVFVNQLPGEGQTAEDQPEASPADSTSSTTTPDGTQDDPGETAPTDTTGGEGGEGGETGGEGGADPQNYLDAMGALGAQLTTFQAELASANSGWDNDELSLSETEDRFATLNTNVADWAEQVAAVEVPPDLADAHQQMQEAAQAASAAAAAALDGLVNSPTAEARQAAVGNFDEAVSQYQEALAGAGG